MTGLIVAILFFSSIAITFTPQFTKADQIQTEKTPITDTNLPEIKEEQTFDPIEIPQTSILPLNTTEYEQQTQPEPEQGTITTIGVNIYLDRSLNNPLTSINWGNLKPGTIKNIKSYIKNTGQSKVTLHLQTSNWTPPQATKYITLTWTYTDQQLDSNKVLPVTLTLTISENIQEITGFTFDIIIIGSPS